MNFLRSTYENACDSFYNSNNIYANTYKEANDARTEYVNHPMPVMATLDEMKTYHKEERELLTNSKICEAKFCLLLTATITTIAAAIFAALTFVALYRASPLLFLASGMQLMSTTTATLLCVDLFRIAPDFKEMMIQCDSSKDNFEDRVLETIEKNFPFKTDLKKSCDSLETLLQDTLVMKHLLHGVRTYYKV